MEIRMGKSNIHLIVILKGETKENGEEALTDELMTENVTEPMGDRNPQVRELRCDVRRLNKKKHS